MLRQSVLDQLLHILSLIIIGHINVAPVGDEVDLGDDAELRVVRTEGKAHHVHIVVQNPSHAIIVARVHVLQVTQHTRLPQEDLEKGRQPKL